VCSEKETNGPAISSIVIRGHRPQRLVARLVVRPERLILGMEATVHPGQLRDDGVLEEEQRVARDEVAPVHLLADQHRVLVRAVVVGDVQFVESATRGRELQRGAAQTDLSAGARDPVRRVARREDEVRGRRWGGCGRGGGVTAAGERQTGQCHQHRPPG
jgi:hypothetical protein